MKITPPIIYMAGVLVLSVGLYLIAHRPLTSNVVVTSQTLSRKSRVPLHHAIAYATYVNPRFGFSIKYPRKFRRESPPENGDGIGCYDKQGFRMTASGINNVLNDTLASEMAENRRDFGRITYMAKGSNWFAISGISGVKILYRKTFVGKGSINELDISYPAALKDSYNWIVKSIVSSFKPGRLAEAD